MDLQPDLARVMDNILESADEDLLDRVTVYRAGMDANALILIEDELRHRGFGPAEIRDHEEQLRGKILVHADDAAVMCRYCRRPAVARRWVWHHIRPIPLLPLGVPLVPMRYPVCREHVEGDA